MILDVLLDVKVCEGIIFVLRIMLNKWIKNGRDDFFVFFEGLVFECLVKMEKKLECCKDF